MIRRRRTHLAAVTVDPAVAAALIARVHGLACAWCSTSTTNTPDRDGWPMCPGCTAGATRWGSRWPSAAVADVLGIDADTFPLYAFGRLVAPRFADHPGAAADRPGTPWGYVDVLARADLLDRLRSLTAEARDLASGGPCSRCGSAFSTAWHDGPENGRPICASCATASLHGPMTADAVAAALVGLAGSPTGCAAALGLIWFADAGAPLTGEPWHHVDIDAMRARAAESWPHPGEWVSREAARAAGVIRAPAPVIVAPHLFEAGPCRLCGTTLSAAWFDNCCRELSP